MKFNLKNRPVPDAPDEFSIEGLAYPDSLEKWFEGFEKELRSQVATFDRSVADKKHVKGFTQYGRGIYDTIKEILGEE